MRLPSIPSCLLHGIIHTRCNVKLTHQDRRNCRRADTVRAQDLPSVAIHSGLQSVVNLTQYLLNLQCTVLTGAHTSTRSLSVASDLAYSLDHGGPAIVRLVCTYQYHYG